MRVNYEFDQYERLCVVCEEQDDEIMFSNDATPDHTRTVEPRSNLEKNVA